MGLKNILEDVRGAYIGGDLYAKRNSIKFEMSYSSTIGLKIVFHILVFNYALDKS